MQKQNVNMLLQPLQPSSLNFNNHHTVLVEALKYQENILGCNGRPARAAIEYCLVGQIKMTLRAKFGHSLKPMPKDNHSNTLQILHKGNLVEEIVLFRNEDHILH